MFKKYPALITLLRLWLFGFLIAIPFSTKYVVNSSAAISYINIFSVGFIGLALLAVLVKQLPVVGIRDRGLLIVLGLLMLAMGFALFFTDPLRNGVGLWTSRLLQPLLVGFFVYQMLRAGLLRLEELMQVLLLSLIPLIIGGVLQFTGVIPYKDGAGRITVAYEWPNTFARYVEILLLVTLPFIWFKLEKYRIAAGLVWISGLGLLLSTISYNGIATTLVAGMVFLLLLPHTYNKLKYVVFMVIALCILLGALNTSKIPKWQTSLNDSRVTRLEFWEIAVGTIKDNFWTGIGIKGWEKNYGQLLEKYDTPPHLNYSSPQPHNIFLDSWLKAGPLGLIAITILLLWPVYQGFRLYRKSQLSEYGWYGLSMVLYGIGMFLFGVIDDPLWSDDVTPLLYIFLFSLAFAHYIRDKQTK